MFLLYSEKCSLSQYFACTVKVRFIISCFYILIDECHTYPIIFMVTYDKIIDKIKQLDGWE